MPGPVPGIHVFPAFRKQRGKNRDGRSPVHLHRTPSPTQATNCKISRASEFSIEYFAETFAMSDTTITGFFLVMGLCAITGLVSAWRTGISLDNPCKVDVRALPALFYVRIAIQIVFIAFCCAVVLHALGLIGDPFAWMRAHAPFLMPRSR
jgi:hypothetical protein